MRAVVRDFYPADIRDKVQRCIDFSRLGYFRCPCRHALCPACLPTSNWLAYQRAYATFRAATPPKSRVAIIHDVFTLPPYLRGRVLDNDALRAWRAAIVRTERRILAYHPPDGQRPPPPVRGFPDVPQGGEHPAVGGVMTLHQIGDDPSRFHPHYDVIVNARYLDAAGKFRVHDPPYIPFGEARAIYAEELIRAFRLRPEEEPRSVVLHLGRRDGAVKKRPVQVKQRIRYSVRNPYYPHAASLIEVEFAAGGPRLRYQPDPGKPSKRYDADATIRTQLHLLRRLPLRNRRVWFGQMSKGGIAKLRRAAANAGGKEGTRVDMSSKSGADAHSTP